MTAAVLGVVHQHADSVLALRIVFSICLAIVFFAGLYIFRIRKRLFSRDPQVIGDHYGAQSPALAGDPCLASGHGPSHFGSLEAVARGVAR